MKTVLYEQVARIGKALSSPKRLEILELLMQGEKSVEKLVALMQIDLKLASAHLRSLREASLVETRREGKHIYYRLSSDDIVGLLVKVREVAEEHLIELRIALEQMSGTPEHLSSESRESLLSKARAGDIVVIDVRPSDEFAAGHLPFARSMPLAELQHRIDELPLGRPVIAYCRGPYCVMSDAAVELLRNRGFSAYKIRDGIGEWRAAGMPLEP